MTRRMNPDVVCACCGHVGGGWVDVEPGEHGREYVTADNPTMPPLCDRCELAQRRWDARQYQIRIPTAGYPYFERPPLTPPVRRPGDRDLAADGWPK